MGRKPINDSIIHADSTAAIVTSIDQRFSKRQSIVERPQAILPMTTPDTSILQADTCIAITEEKKGNVKTLWECTSLRD